MEAAMADIRIVTSSLCGTQLEDAFKAGLTSEGYGETTVEKVELDGKYDDKEGAGVSDLYTEMQAADDEPGWFLKTSLGTTIHTPLQGPDQKSCWIFSCCPTVGPVWIGEP